MTAPDPAREALETLRGGWFTNPERDSFMAALAVVEQRITELEGLLRIPGQPPYRIGGIPPGIISADDYDVTYDALAALAALAAAGEDAHGNRASTSSAKQTKEEHEREQEAIDSADFGPPGARAS